MTMLEKDLNEIINDERGYSIIKRGRPFLHLSLSAKSEADRTQKMLLGREKSKIWETKMAS